MEYEAELNRGIGDQPMLVLCTYPLTTCGAAEFLDVAGTHQFAVAKRRGRWEVVETAWGWGCRSAVPSLRLTEDGCGPAATRITG